MTIDERIKDIEPSNLALAITMEFIPCPCRNGKLPPEGIRMAKIVQIHLNRAAANVMP